MSFTEAQAWARNLGRIWESQDVDAACALFANAREYLETPYSGNAAEQEDGIRRLWAETLRQRNIKVHTDVECASSRRFVSSYVAEYSIDGAANRTRGIWIVVLDHSGRCTSFRQYTAAPPVNRSL